MRAGEFASCYNVHTGRTTQRVIKSISPTGKKIVVDRADWKTGKAEFFYRTNYEGHFCDYASEVISGTKELLK